MNLLTLDTITKAYTDRALFQQASFYLQEGEKVGVVGINGTGKSTLLKIMAGLEEPDSGEVIRANHVVIRYLPQAPEFQAEDTVLEAALRDNCNKLNEWTIENDAKTMLTKLNITNFEQKVQELSGGQRKRIALVSALLSPADILILDEPTNHLDHEMNDWLEDFLKKWKKTLVMVTHDRYFLESVTNCILEIDKGSMYKYQTNYSGFVQLKAERADMEQASERKRKSILKIELEWMMRGARARSTKSKSRIERFETLSSQAGPQADQKVQLSSVSSRLGRTTVELQHICKAYGDKVLIKDFSYIFLKNDRIGFVGENGSGKTTLMKIIAGRLEPDQGERVIGPTVKIGYYTQEILEKEEKQDAVEYMNPSIRVIDYIKDIAEYVQTEDGSISASQMLERFLFPPDQQYSPIGKLSGGEKRRLNLLKVLVEAPNVLVLDEPTNDLDITTLTILEDYLDHFQGIVIVVSHDRYFLDRTVNRIFSFEEDGFIKQYEGGYSDYHVKRQQEDPEKKVTTSEKEKPVKIETKEREKKLKFTYQEQKEFDTIVADMQSMEEKKSRLEEEMNLYARDFVKLAALTKEKEELEELLEEKLLRWMYLEELSEKIKEQNS